MNEHIKFSLSVNKGIWHVSFRLLQENGKRKQKCLSTGIKAGSNGKSNKRLAEKKAYEIVSKFQNLIYNDKSEMSLGDYIKYWVRRNKVNIQPTTFDGYMHMVDKHIAPYFTMNVKSVKPLHIQEYMNSKIENGLSNNTVGKHYTLIKTALKDAVINDLIKSNPAEKVKKPKKAKIHHNFYTAEQLKILIEAVRGSDMELPVMLAVLFGLRRSEVAAVKWSNIDFENMTLEVCEKVTRQKSKDGKLEDTLSNEMKTESSHAVYYLNAPVRSYLMNKYLEQQAMPRETNLYTDYVCVNAVGILLKLDYITHKFKKILEANGLPVIRFHDLRHSCISLLASNNSFTMKQVQDYARHANYALTADTYSHVVSNDKLIELNAICNSLNITDTVK